MHIAVERYRDEIWIPLSHGIQKIQSTWMYSKNYRKRNSMNTLETKPAMPAQHEAQKKTQWFIQQYEMKTKHILGR